MRWFLPFPVFVFACGGGGGTSDPIPCGPLGECPAGLVCDSTTNTCVTSGHHGVDAGSDLPVTTIIGTPADGANSPSNEAMFELRSDPAGASFSCSLDGVPPAPCTSPVTLQGLADGSHTFAAQAVLGDLTGAVARISWTVDTVPPTITLSEAPPPVTNMTQASFVFVASDGDLRCQLDSAAPAACASPAQYSALSEGDHTFVVTATDAAGNVAAASHAWTVNTAAPVVTIDSGPPDPTRNPDIAFAFTAPAGTSVECQLDAAAPAPCVSPQAYSAVADGAHSFTVTARDAAGNVGTARRVFMVDTKAPTVMITGGPSSPTNATAASFTFTASDGRITCQLDAAAPAACSSPAPYSGLPDGAHTFVVRATDAAGNVGSATHRWTVSTGAPTVTITGAPPAASASNQADFTFTTSGGTLACRLDGGAAAACSSPRHYAGLADGPHGFTVQATDPAGNVGSASHAWTVDTQPPTVTIDAGPANPSNAASGSFAFTASEGATTCRFDSGAFAPCSGVATYSGLGNGSHTFTVRATDAAGNVGSATRSWTIDTVVPVVTIVPPANPSNAISGSLSFSATEGTLGCSLDGASFTACASPVTYSALADGSHTFAVRATDAAGNVGNASVTWRIDTRRPIVTLSGPSGTVNVRTATFTFSTNEGTLSCALDGGAATTPCTSPRSLTNLADGAHSFTVSARDPAGNVGTATATWTVDTVVPVVTITGGRPPDPTNQTSASFSFTASDGTITCTLDTTTAPCTSPKSYSGLLAGAHTFTVKATDPAGNVGSAGATWTIDLTPPTVTFGTVPPALDNRRTPSFTFTVSEGAPRCALDGGAAASCASPYTTPSLADGSHTLVVSTTDAAGNTGSRSHTWTVDATPPIVQLTFVNVSNLSGRSEFTFSASDGTPSCTLDGGSWPCTPGTMLSFFVWAGTHEFLATARDAAGNVGSASRAWIVDACVEQTGNDNIAGTCDPGAAYRTVSRALRTAVPGQTVRVGAGVYNVAHGEDPTLVVPPLVRLLGNDFLNVELQGAGLVGDGQTTATVVAGAFSVIENLVITGLGTAAVYVSAPGVIIQDNFLDFAEGSGVMVVGTDVVIRRNSFYRGLNIGVYGVNAGGSIEDNRFIGYPISVYMVGRAFDLGGGGTSHGGNILACYLLAGIWSEAGGTVVHADHNIWDRNPPTTTTICGNGEDFCSPTDTLQFTTASKYIEPCP